MKKRKPKNNRIELNNDGKLSLFTVGCGSAFAKTLSQNNVLLIKGNTHLLVDCGTKTPGVLFHHAIPITDITNFIITHSHADHIGGLEEAMLMSRYVARKKPNIVITPEYQKLLWNQSLRGGCEQNERHDGTTLNFEDFWHPLRPTAVKNSTTITHEIQLGDL
ncbi:MAG: MBL fold metallo-hydrolase, partial [Spirochaetaceae bacterium]